MEREKETWVSKFGGTSLANAAQIQKVRDIILSEPRRKVVVVSAPGKEYDGDEKITDLLYACHRLSKEGKSFDDVFDVIRTRFLAIADALQVGKHVEDDLKGIYQRIPREFLPDYAASRGEYLTAKMIAEYLGARFVDTEGMISLTRDGRIVEQSYERTANTLIDQDVRYVIPGFYGTNPEGKIKTFSRGGSDITGAIAARAIGAALYENWTDVSGLRMADPRIVKDAKIVREITYREIRELASIGANVFHEEAIAPVRNGDIPIQIKNTNDPQAEGTCICSQRDVHTYPVVGVSGKFPYRRVIIEKFMLNRYIDFPSQVNRLLDSMELRADVTIAGFDSITLYIGVEQLNGEVSELYRRIQEELDIDACEISDPLAMIGIVGEGVPVSRELLEKALTALRESSIEAISVTSGNSPLSMLISVSEREYRQALPVLTHAVADWNSR